MPSLRPQSLEPLPRVSHRVVLRRLSAVDLKAFQAYRRSESVGRYQGWSVQTDEQALAFIQEMSRAPLFLPGQWIQLAIADRKTDGLIGDIGACVAVDGHTAELGFTVCPQSQGQGLGTEAVIEAIALLFEHSTVARILCITDARNGPSIRLLERIKMQRVGSANAVFRGEPCIEYTYEVIRHQGG